MKPRNPVSQITVLLSAVALMLSATATSFGQIGQISARALSPQEIHDYGLPANIQRSGGLFTVGLGQPLYLEAMISNSIPASNILSVTWLLTNTPAGSTATLAPSPLGTNIPIYSPGDREIYRLVDRRLLRPDVAGQYTVRVTITTTTGSIVLTRTNITAGTYMGINTCALCHSGGIIAEDKYTAWSQTGHASFFTEAIDGKKAPYYNKNCISCHTLGYDTNAFAVNGGFDDVASNLGWQFPSTLTNGNWAAMPATLKNLANIQCENCHGAGSQHAFSLGNTNMISLSFSSGDCAQCHDDQPYHYKNAEWNNSRHAVATRYPTGENRAACVRCHSSIGFVDYVNGTTPPRTGYEAITCAGCHDPHNAANPHQLRRVGPVTLMDGFTTITNGGKGQLCMNCHLSRQNATNYVETANGSAQFGPHHGPQSDMLAGANAVTYGKVIPSSSHREVVGDACVTCHLQDNPLGSPGFLEVGGHTFRPGWDGGTPNNTADDVHLTKACAECHGNITSFNFPRQDYDGNGLLEGVQTEVRGLLNQLAFMLPPVGTPKSSITINSSWTRQQLRAGYNYLFVLEDGSFGVHNLAYAVGLLKASIADLSGDANKDGLPDWWQISYFGSITNVNAAPNATPANDGVPNWLKYSLGLNPMVAGIVLPDGVLWVNANMVGGTNAANSIQIYTAAEVVFNTETGKTYQLQSISNLGGGWQNVGAPVTGSGTAMSFLTPTRGKAQQFYRVMHTP